MTDIQSTIEEIVLKAQETESDFIFQTIRPYCENIVQKKISKRDLEKALLQYFNQEPCEDCISRIIEQIDKSYAYFESGDVRHGFDICKYIINKELNN